MYHVGLNEGQNRENKVVIHTSSQKKVTGDLIYQAPDALFEARRELAPPSSFFLRERLLPPFGR